VFENRVLRRLFGPVRDEVIGGLTKVDNEELANLHPLPDVIRLIDVMGGKCSMQGRERGSSRVLCVV
jgi:hypothetical protein